jgi:hypothetical protein
MPAKPSTRKTTRSKATFYLNDELLEEARGAMIAMGYEGRGPNSLSDLVNEALEREMARLRRRFNGGRRFKPYPRKLPAGRPRSK